MRTSPRSSPPSRARERRYRDRFLPADWPVRVAHLRAQYKPTGLVFPAVPHYGWCDCSEPCRVGACRNSLMQLYCTPSCCPYDAKCGNSLEESTKVYLARNTRTLQLSVVAAEDIDAGEVLGQYLGEFEHVSVDPARRPRNEGFRLMMTQRPERPSHPIRVAVNAAEMGGLMRFVNHSCSPVAQFVEVANGRRTTVIVATTEVVREGEEITVDYGGDLWFAKEIKQSIDDKASVEEMDDGADVDAQEEEEGRSRRTAESKGYISTPNRLGGGNLAAFRETIDRKRGADDDDDLHEASYAKVKRVKATKAAAHLKKRDEVRRAEEEQRRCDDILAREMRYNAEKKKAEERRRQEKLETEERSRRDKEEACARSQELMPFISALVKKE
ncbi:Myosin-J heavy chain [Phytophthora nicotianae]|uniref:Myosin-J heavy chain n=1 Tax=Phytophthora nicotianae TaxID=4792 RepID=A0A0W8DKQ5_PHYNI|nr:Myosin-J heavy chain [Phytophthora nicotianae]